MWWNKADFSAAITLIVNMINDSIATFDQINASLPNENLNVLIN